MSGALAKSIALSCLLCALLLVVDRRRTTSVVSDALIEQHKEKDALFLAAVDDVGHHIRDVKRFLKKEKKHKHGHGKKHHHGEHHHSGSGHVGKKKSHKHGKHHHDEHHHHGESGHVGKKVGGESKRRHGQTLKHKHHTKHQRKSSTGAENDTETRPNVYEAEANTELWHCKRGTTFKGYTGSGYADMRSRRRAWVEWDDVEVDTAGTYELRVRYAVRDHLGRKCDLVINGSDVAILNLSQTGKWSSWKTETIRNVDLLAGRNTIRIESQGKGPNLDSVEVVSVPSSLNEQDEQFVFSV